MKHTFLELVHFIKHPNYKKDNATCFKDKLTVFAHILAISLFTSIALLIPIRLILELFGMAEIEHDLNTLLSEHSIYFVLFMATMIAPFFEELVFRAPLRLFKNKNYFPIVFYFSAIAFGTVHIFNYQISTKLLVIAPILIMPQLILGLYFGYIRTRFGLRWSMLVHACYNAILMLPVILFETP